MRLRRFKALAALGALALALGGCAEELRPTANAEDVIAAVDHAQSLVDRAEYQPDTRREGVKTDRRGSREGAIQTTAMH